MKCYYEVLDVPRDASDTDIKVAYRKLALKYHPDKNLENPLLAKEQFQTVQQAYDVLSDRQERAWYDNHREQILRGSNSEFQDKSLDVFQYFTTSCFKGYDDSENGFYTVYRNVFENIAKEDMEFMEDKDEFCEVPGFGNTQTDFDRVAEFYNYWLNYSTKKSYVWLDPYDISGARDRRYVKLVEKENKKVRLKAKKERNEEVRNLVAFVKKRDKRVQAQKKVQEQKSLDNKKKRDLLSKQKKLQRQQELNESKDEPEWSKFDNVKSELEAIEKNLAEQFGDEFSDSDDEDEEKYSNNMYCVACNKIFKTPKAFENHELSRKHKENISALKESMMEENGQFEDNGSDLDFDRDEGMSDCETQDETQQKRKKKKKPKTILSVNVEETLIDMDTDIVILEKDEPVDFTVSTKQKKKNRKSGNKSKTNDESNNTHMKDTNKKSKVEKKPRKENGPALIDIDTDHVCVTCKSNFPSKNKLFDHLKKSGHITYIPSDIKSKQKIVK